MFYRKEENGEWSTGSVIETPEGRIDKKNQENEYGFVWYDEPPKEYTEWEEANS